MHTRDTKENTKPQTQRVTTKKHTDSKQPQRETHWRRRCKNAFKKLQKDTTETGNNLQETHNNLRDTTSSGDTKWRCTDTKQSQSDMHKHREDTKQPRSKQGQLQKETKCPKSKHTTSWKHLCRHTREIVPIVICHTKEMALVSWPPRCKYCLGIKLFIKWTLTAWRGRLLTCVEKRWTQNNSQENHRVARGAARNQNVSGYTSWWDRSQCAFI